jgi:hypothetical protein
MPATAGYVHEPGNSGYRLQAHDYTHSVIPWLPGQCPFYTTDSHHTVMIRESAIRFIRRRPKAAILGNSTTILITLVISLTRRSP